MIDVWLFFYLIPNYFICVAQGLQKGEETRFFSTAGLPPTYTCPPSFLLLFLLLSCYFNLLVNSVFTLQEYTSTHLMGGLVQGDIYVHALRGWALRLNHVFYRFNSTTTMLLPHLLLYRTPLFFFFLIVSFALSLYLANECNVNPTEPRLTFQRDLKSLIVYLLTAQD